MRELELAGIPSIDATRPRRDGGASLPLSRAAFIASIAAHLIAGYALSRHVWIDASSPPAPSAEFFLFETPAPRPREAAPAAAPEPVPEVRAELEPPPVPRAAQPAPEQTVVEPAPAVEPAPPAEVVPAPRAAIDFDEERRRAANQVIGSRAAENEYLTFSLDDVVEPRAEPEADRPSIFDGGGADFGGRSVGTLGQQRTKIGRKLAEICNALTGGFGVAFQGFGLFSGCASPDSGPSGLFPEVRPAYLDLMPECVDTRETAPALALEAPFPTVKCRLVEREEIPDELP
jgi:hypothetical protein